jgi:ParB-like chromosome segregation protein Spo0J
MNSELEILSDATVVQATALVRTAGHKPVERVDVNHILPGDWPRIMGADAAHLRRLTESDTEFDPIIACRRTMRVIDGMHRWKAAKRLGREYIDVRFFDGSAEEAFVLAVQLNLGHGLPLTHADRAAAARRIIASNPAWSDRLIASIAGLSARTVGSLKSESGPEPVVRIGRDGRCRPLDAAAGRLAASRVLSHRPDASLREIAREAGVSVATARNVRQRVQAGEDPLPPLQRARNSVAAVVGDGEPDTGPGTRRPWRSPLDNEVHSAEVAEILQHLVRDPSLRFTDSGRRLLRWLLTVTSTLPTWEELAPTVPPHSTYMVADLARRCAAEWSRFADELAREKDLAS